MNTPEPPSVRLKHDPGRRGVRTGQTRTRAGRTYIRVIFPDGSQYVPEDQIESVTDDDAVDLLAMGRVGTADDLRRLLTHVRLSGRLANVLYSMDTTETDFYAYQFKPVLKLLNTIASGLLVADEVGLGKTIEAGLIWTELRSRFDFRRLFVLCPAFLREKWRLELSRRFGVEARIVDAAGCLPILRQATEDPITSQFALIGSLQGLRARRNRASAEGRVSPSQALNKFLSDRQYGEPLIDLLIIDEAHYLRNPEAITSKLGRVMRNVSQYVVMLSATPINLHQGELFNLLRLVDEATFDRREAFDEILTANQPLVRARELVLSGKATPDMLLEELGQAVRHELLAENRQLRELMSRLADPGVLRDRKTASEIAYRMETVNLLGHVVTRMRKRDVTEWRVVRDPRTIWVPMTEVERRFYDTVTDVVRDFASKEGGAVGFLLVTPQRQMSSSMAAALRFWRSRSAYSATELYEDVGQYRNPRAGRAGPLISALTERAADLADEVELFANDSKYSVLRDALEGFFQDQPDGKIILFSYFKATLTYLRDRLRRDGIDTILLYGGMQDKDGIVAEFKNRPGRCVLLTSEVGSEGIDLQFCWTVVNYDLPWNPMRVEQRIGRVDRLGQKSPKVSVWNLVYADTIDGRIYERLMWRLEIFTRSLGGLEPILGDQIQRLTQDLLTNRLTPEQEQARIEQTAQAIENIRKEEEVLEGEAASLMAYGDYILNQVRAARELNRRITGEDIFHYVHDFLALNYAGCEFRQREGDGPDFSVRLSTAAAHDLDEFIRSQRLAATTHLLRADARDFTFRFENSVLPSRENRIELIGQLHPLVRFITHKLRGDLQARHPVAAVSVARSVLKNEIEPGVYVFAVQQWGIRGLQDTDRLFFAATPVDGDAGVLDENHSELLIVLAAREGETWMVEADRIDYERAGELANDVCLGAAEKAFREFKDWHVMQNADRADLQEQTLERHFETQRSRLEVVLNGHEAAGRSSLARATEGRIRALEDRVDRKRVEIAARRNMNADQRDVCVGLIQVTD